MEMKDMLSEKQSQGADLLQPWEEDHVVDAWRKLGGAFGGVWNEVGVQVRRRLRHTTHLRKLESFHPDEIVTIMVAMSRSGEQPRALVEKFTAHLSKRLDTFQAKEVTQVLHSLARMNKTSDQFLNVAGEWMADKLDDLDEKEIATSVWALGKLNFKDESNLMRAVAKRMLGRLDQCSPQGLAQLISGMSKLQYRHRAFLNEFCEEVSLRLMEFSEQTLMTIVNAIAYLRHRDEYFTKSVSQHILSDAIAYGSHKERTAMVKAVNFMISMTMPQDKRKLVQLERLRRGPPTRALPTDQDAQDGPRRGRAPAGRGPRPGMPAPQFLG